MSTMTTLTAVEILRNHNEWRRGGDGTVDVTELGIAIDTVVADVPELLEALEDLVRINEEHNSAVEDVIGRPLGWKDDYLDKARAAIRKARGESHD